MANRLFKKGDIVSIVRGEHSNKRGYIYVYGKTNWVQLHTPDGPIWTSDRCCILSSHEPNDDYFRMICTANSVHISGSPANNLF